jgi:hypothetical protein
VILSLALYFVLPGESLGRLAFAAVFFVAAYAIYANWTNRSIDQRYLKYVREQLGGDGPFRCEVDVSADGITVKQGDVESRRPWTGVRDAVEVAGGIEITFSHGTLLLVRDRAFPSAEVRAEFFQTVRRYISGGAASGSD